MNVKYRGPADIQSQSIDLSLDPQAQTELIEHEDVVQALSLSSASSAQEEYERLRTRERMFVNLLTVFVNSGIKVLGDFIRELAV